MADDPEPSASKPAGRLISGVFFAVFLGVGLFFLAGMGGELLATVAHYFWKPTEATILAATAVETREADRDHSLRVSYGYRFFGSEYISNRFAGKHGPEPHPHAHQIAHDLTASEKVRCYVNWLRPSESVIERGNLALAPFLLVPLVFVYLGGRGLRRTFRRHTELPENPASAKSSTAFVRVVGLIFLAIGLGLFLVFDVWPWWLTRMAAGWQKATAEIILSRVRSEGDRDSATFRPEVVFGFSARGRSWIGDQYDFSAVGMDYDRAAGIVAKCASKTRVPCFYDPAAPEGAVLVREFHPRPLAVALPALFVGLGLVVWWRGRGVWSGRVP